MNCEIKKDKTFTVQFNELTNDELIVLINSLKVYQTISPIANDLRIAFKRGFREMIQDTDTAKRFMEIINEDIGLKVIKEG